MPACARRTLIAVLALLLAGGTVIAADGTPVPRHLTLSPDLVRVAGGDRAGPAAAPVADPDKAWQTLFSEDFEGTFPGDDWTIYSTSGLPYWGVWDCWSGDTPSHSAGCAAAGPGAIGCGSLTPDNMGTWIVAGPFDLSAPSITAGDLSCILNLASEPTADYFLISVSTDGEQFYGLQYEFLVLGETVQLDLAAVPDLGDVLGSNQVWIGFYFTTDWSVSYGVGAQIDDVLLRVDMPASNVPPEVTLTSPNGGESWLAGSQHDITWTATDPDGGPNALTVDLAYSLNGGGTWTPIAAGRPNTGSYAWTLPTQASTNAGVRITVSDGEDTDTVDAGFTILVPGTNTLIAGDGAGDSGTSVTVSLGLDNEDPVKGLQADLVFNGTLASLADVTAVGRGAGMTVGGEMIGAGRARVLLFFDGAGALNAGTGEIAQLTLNLIGPGGTTALTPENVVLAGPEAEAWVAGVRAGSLQVAPPDEVPTVDIAVMKNPGRPRSLQVFVTVANGSGTAPTVTVGGTALAVTATGAGNVFLGRAHVAGTVGSVTVQASDTNGVGTGSDQVTVQFP